MDARSLRGWIGVVVVGGLVSAGAREAEAGRARTRNFVVDAPTQPAAEAVARHAEALRKTIARAWLGRELPDWPKPCPVYVKLTGGEPGGVTTFDFAEGGGVTHQEIRVEGRLERILASALPHEITHTIFAAYFGGPMPRWADEGASLLSEDERELAIHDRIVLELLARRGELPLAQLFEVEEYPKDLLGFYGQGYSVSRFLVEIGGRPRFLQFVKEGMGGGWDAAARKHYGLSNCRELDRAWRAWHKVTLASGKPSKPPLIVRAQSADEGMEARSAPVEAVGMASEERRGRSVSVTQ
ncbi:MAG: hypothetical protein KatS3mg108_3104 [Isosphaeraceae bacterium]|jgi:hypothetical protein|nr:MAG: hypothetical protein KatS3mg108_3104 [Isosphaeraceae bacterium]